MIVEGLNININDIEDNDLREKVIKYFKTFKKGKLEDKDLNKLDDEESKDEESKDEESKDEESKDEESKESSDEDVDRLMDTLAEFDDLDDEKDEDPDWDDNDILLKSYKKALSKKDKKEIKESILTERERDTKSATFLTDKLEITLGNIKERILLRKKIRKINKQLAYLQYRADHAISKNEKKKWEANIDFIKKSNFDNSGYPLMSKKAQRKRVAELIKDGRINTKDIVSRPEMRKLKNKFESLSEKEKNEYRDKTKEDTYQYLSDKNELISNFLAKRELKNSDKWDDDFKDSKSDDDFKDSKSDDDKHYNKDEGKYNKSEGKYNKDDVKKDEEGNIVKKEEITDKDGKKIKVTTHTGPRGGKFYWPEGSPKDTEHKIYISHDGKVKECMDLKDYLNESFN